LISRGLFLHSRINIHIRQAEPLDAPVIVEFNLRLAAETEELTLDPACVAAGVAALLQDRGKGLYFVAEIDGAVIGQVMITYEWSDWRNGILWWLQSVYVKEAFRRAGVFRALFGYLQELARARKDVRGIRLYMHGDNLRARHSYEKLGMKHTRYEVFEMGLDPASSGGLE
jgi:GNAT superfamily N-acetyltransferase